MLKKMGIVFGRPTLSSAHLCLNLPSLFALHYTFSRTLAFSPRNGLTIPFGINNIEFSTSLPFLGASQMAQEVKNSLAVKEMQVGSLGQEDCLEEKLQPTPVFLPGKSYGQ